MEATVETEGTRRVGEMQEMEVTEGTLRNRGNARLADKGKGLSTYYVSRRRGGRG